MGDLHNHWKCGLVETMNLNNLWEGNLERFEEEKRKEDTL